MHREAANRIAAIFGQLERKRPYMNKTDVIRTVSEKAGIESNICEKVIKAFEEQAGDALVGTIQGTKTNHAELLAGISGRTGIRQEDCEKVMTALEEVVSAGISDKLNFFKRMFSRN
jgi:nucleoid DNA-binding protein